MRRLGVLSVLLCAATAFAQSVGPAPAEGARASAGQASAAQATPTTEAQREQKLMQILDPGEYAPAFTVGAQAELIVPSTGASGILLGYDAVWMQTELSVGFGVGDDVEEDRAARDVYVLGLRFGFPLHRGIRSDFSFIAGGGVTVIDAVGGDADPIASGAAGAKFRVFMTPNLAVAGTLGIVALFRGDRTAVLAGARPLGSAAVVYFFR